MPAITTLARWLGPWADSTKAPRVSAVDDDVGGIRVRIYGTRRGRSQRAFLVAPGLHYAGPDDPRMDRFCRILAAAGHLVVAPFVPSYLALTPNAKAIADFTRVAEALPRWTDKKPVVFSISFGSLLAFALAAEHPALVDKLVIFGGYADFHETMTFCLTGQVSSGRAATRDPLNQPVVLLNLLDHILPAGRNESDPLLVHDRSQAEALMASWRAYVERTWGRPEMKVDRAFVAVAEALAPEVPESIRELFLVGIGVMPGAWELAVPALEKFDASALDPSPYLPRVTCRVDLVHGTDDDVIPFEQSHVLAAGLVNADVHTHITGMYGHTGAQRPPLTALARELATMIRVLRVLAG
jgi:pimeloyl-ACP methyl ester carboxylesterase